MLSISFRSRVVWSLSFFAAPAFGDITPRLFQWQFQDTALSSELPTCSPIPIIVKSFDPTTNATNGIPPYYMISFAVGQTPVTDLIGTDENNLSWTITQPPQSQLLLSVVDSAGNPGGVPPQLITVIPGQTTDCVSTPSNTPAFTVTSNVTGDIETCTPWGITVSGGSPPYVVTLAETDSPVVTNVTMPFGTDRFTYINRGNPNGRLIAAVSDLEGRWALGTPVVNPVGSSDVDCTGLVSSSGNSTLINEQDAAINAAAAAAKHRRTTTIAIVVVILLLLLAAASGVAFWKIKQRKQRMREETDATLPTQFPAASEESQIAPGRWRVGSDEKSTAARRDVEAPPYREFDRIPATIPPGSMPAVEPFSPPLSGRPQLPRLQVPPSALDIREKPARYLESATVLVSSSGPVSSLNSQASSRRVSPDSGASASNSRFSKFPVTSVRKNSTAGNANTVLRSASAFTTSLSTSTSTHISRNATVATNTLVGNSSRNINPFIIEEEDEVLNNYARYYQDSEPDKTPGRSGLPPRYRSLKGRGQHEADA